MSEVSVKEAYEKWCADLVSYAAAVVGPHDAADVVADTFVRVVERESRLWPDVREPRGYLFRAVLNEARQHHRGRGRRERREWRLGQRGPEHQLLADPAVVAALADLSLQQRAVTYLTYWEDLDPAAIASMLEVSVGTVKRQLARARSRLREVLS